MPVFKSAITDIAELTILINSAYRGEVSKKGWTTEANLLDGIRIDGETLATYFDNPAVTMLKYVDAKGDITGSVYLEKRGSKLYLGMFSVSPLAQAQGIGRKLLLAAEDFAREVNCPTLTMTVISIRTELIDWYKRRGYQPTGAMLPFPADEKFGVPRQHIELMVLEKSI